MLLQPLAYKDPGALFAVRELRRAIDVAACPGQPGPRARMGEQCPSLEQVALMRGVARQIAAGSEPARSPAPRDRTILRALRRGTDAGPTFLAEEKQEAAIASSSSRNRCGAPASTPTRRGRQSILIDGDITRSSASFADRSGFRLPAACDHARPTRARGLSSARSQPARSARASWATTTTPRSSV